MKSIKNTTLALLWMSVMGLSAHAIETSSFCEAQVPGTYVIEAEEGAK